MAWNRRNYVENGFGLWAVETSEGEPVGDCGLTMQDVEGDPLVEIGWHTRPSLRGVGYATEAAVSAVAAARGLGVSHVVAIIRSDDVTGRRVAEKIGLRHEREVDSHGEQAGLYGAGLG